MGSKNAGSEVSGTSSQNKSLGVWKHEISDSGSWFPEHEFWGPVIQASSYRDSDSHKHGFWVSGFRSIDLQFLKSRVYFNIKVKNGPTLGTRSRFNCAQN